MVHQRRVLWLPSTVIGSSLGLTWLLTGGLASCDSTAKFSLSDVKFQGVQVVSAFPAFIADDHSVVRVCGGKIDPSDPNEPEPLKPNGLELVVNLLSTKPDKAACTDDKDLSIKDNELVEQKRVRATGLKQTVGPNNFTLQFDCIDERTPGNPACKTALNGSLPAAELRYQALSTRCNPDNKDSAINVAILIDHSGSTSGFVDGKTGLEEPPALVNVGKFGDDKSDPFNNRTDAAKTLIETLNPNDRAIAYYFDEQGVGVAASDSFACAGGSLIDAQDCSGPADTKCTGGICAADPTETAGKFKDLAFGDLENAAFGPVSAKKEFLKLGIDLKAKFKGAGRAPIWEALNTAAHLFERNSASGGGIARQNKHIVIIADGPDTCTETDQFFNYKDLSGAGTCRSTCAATTTQYKLVMQYLAGLNDTAGQNLHIVVDVIQFQSAAVEYQQPDARMMEVACRTGGTYQFINTKDFVRVDANSYRAIDKAVSRVRNSLAGSWRPAFKDGSIANGEIPPGIMQAVRGSLQFSNTKFPSLASTYTTTNDWGFRYEGGVTEDRRLLFRTACLTNADCGGTGDDPCSAKHCTPAGMCEDAPARDRLPCGESKRCCDGKCGTDKCDKACK
jgi:hypothetical protein